MKDDFNTKRKNKFRVAKENKNTSSYSCLSVLETKEYSI